MNKKMMNVIKSIVIFLAIAMLVFSLVVSQDEHHLEICHEENCTHCVMIEIAQIIISVSIVFLITVLVGVLIYFFLSRLHKNQNVFVLFSLVFQNVQLNE